MSIPPSLDELRFFATVAHQGSFGRAARELTCTQPAVSARIAQLEQKLGVSLFDRGPRGATLTHAGERLLPYAIRALGVVEEGVLAARDQAPGGRFNIHSLGSVAHSLVPAAIDALEPLGLRMSTTYGHTADILASLVDGVADVGFVVPGPAPRSVRIQHLLDDPVVCVAAPSHRMVATGSRSVEELAGSALAINAWGKGAEDFLRLIDNARFRAAEVRTVSPAATAAALARRHGHVAILVRSAVMDELASGELVEVGLVDLPSWSVALGLAYRERDSDTEAVAVLRSTPSLRRTAVELPDPAARRGSRKATG